MPSRGQSNPPSGAKSAAEILEELLPPNFMGEITPDGPRETDINKRKRREALKQLHDEVIELIGANRMVINAKTPEAARQINIENQLKAALRTKVGEYFKKESKGD